MFFTNKMSQYKRDLKKLCHNPTTVGEKNQKSNCNSNDSLNSSENQNESFIEVFKSYAKKAKPVLSCTQRRNHVEKETNDIEELFSSCESKVALNDKSCKIERPSTFTTKLPNSTCLKEFSDIFQKNSIQFCPICNRKNYSEQSSFINHVKSCAARNNITTEQLMSALELQQKQINERISLGLPMVANEKSKKTYQRKGPVDSNLELGIALSTSLRDSEILCKIQEKEMLIEAGIEPETLSQFKNLEDFGFASTKPMENPISRGSNRSKNLKNTALFTRSKEERDRIITEKVAILLIDSDSEFVTAEDDFQLLELKSNYLKSHRDENASLWKKSTQMDENIISSYYVENLSNFITPCEVNIGAKLKHLSQIPGRSPSPNKRFSIPKLTTTKTLKSNENLPKKISPKNIDHNLSIDWKNLLNNKMFSDITIYAKYETPIYAHKLVFYTRCRSILQDVIKETENEKTREILMWMEFSFETITTFLEYIYSGTCCLKFLEQPNKKEFRELSNRYGFKNLIDLVDELNVDAESTASFFNLGEEKKFSEKRCSVDLSISPESHILERNKGVENLDLLQIAFQTQNRTHAMSPEMFEVPECSSETVNDKKNDSDSILNNSKKIIDEVLSNLCSPVACSELPQITVISSSPEILSENSLTFSPDRSPLTQLVDLTISDRNKKENKDKRKSSPLQNNSRKKSKLGTPKKRRTPKKPSLSEVLLVSDTEVSEEDKMDKNEPKPLENCDPYVSPVWDGFDDFNIDFNNEFSPPRNEITSLTQEPIKVTSSLSKNSNDPLFDSFSIDENFLKKIESKCENEIQSSTPDGIRKFQQRSKSENCITPISNRQVINITPMADYSSMKPEDLKKELDKYGLKTGLSRNKAKMMLRYIYEQLHPYEDEINKPTKDQKSAEKFANRNTDSYDSSCSETSGFSLLEESYVDENQDILSQDPGENVKTKVDLDTGFKNLLREDKALHEKILLYEPVWLEPLKSTLKENGVKCSMAQLMNYLDEKCITFRSQQRGRKKRQLKRNVKHKEDMRSTQ